MIAGTGTEIGKTHVGSAVIRSLREQRRSVIARKFAQSFDKDDVTTDAVALGAASGEDPHTVCPPHRWYPIPMAPPMAAAALGLDAFTMPEIATEVKASFVEADFALVETAGGSWSPQTSDGLHVGDFADALGADAVLLVADAALGVINAVRGALAALGTARPVVVMLNRYSESDGLHVANRDWLIHEDHLTVATSPVEAATLLASL